jgi:glutathione S-transferase
MILRTSTPSPFGRMVKIAIQVQGMADDLSVVSADTNDPDDNLRQQNPLGKIPVLLVGDDALYDTRVILDYLDDRYLAQHSKSVLFPGSGIEVFRLKTQLARVIGMLDAGILMVYENRFRPENMRVESFVDYQRQKVIRSMVEIKSENLTYTNGALPNAAEIALACAFDHYDYRKHINWRDILPEMEAWMMDFAKSVPGYHESLPEDIDPAPWR